MKRSLAACGVIGVLACCVATMAIGATPPPSPDGQAARDGGGRAEGAEPADPLAASVLASRPELAKLTIEETQAAAAAFFAEALARGLTGPEAFSLLMPDADYYMARLSDEDTRAAIVDLADDRSPAGRRYTRIAGLIPEVDETASRYEAIADAYWASEYNAKRGAASKKVPPLPRSEAVVPTKKSLRYAHQDALDVFFANVTRKGAEEIGPTVKSMTDGVVMASYDGWIGTDTHDGYVSGGVSPKAGNGVIVYQPDEKKYYLYFHFYSAKVGNGDVVRAGDTLGLGGNTGYNARKRNHGEHVHLEIFDASTDESLSSTKIRAFVLSLF